MKSIKNFIKENYSDLIILSILFLFFLELISSLVESIYILDLLNTTLDEKVLGILFLLTPLVLIPFRKGISKKIIDILAIIIILFRVLNPFMDTTLKIITAGIGVGIFMIYFPAYLSKVQTSEEEHKSVILGLGLAFAVILLITFKSLLSTVDISIYNGFQAIGWGLAILGGVLIIGRFNIRPSESSNQTLLEPNETTQEEKGSKKIILLVLGLISIIILVYFAFSSPTVISRWTEGNYIAIVLLTSGMTILFTVVMILKPELINNLKSWMIWAWNILFVLSLVLTIVANIIIFPATPSSPPVIVSITPLISYIPLYLMLALLPIIFFDFIFISRELINRKASLPKLGRNFTLGGLLFILLILILIFTNVWGYVDGVSMIFRNMFWLPFLILGIIMAGSTILVKKRLLIFSRISIKIKDKIPKLSILLILFVLTLTGVLINSAAPIPPTSSSVTSLTVFTYNIQQGVNETGQKNLDGQIALVKELNPDIIALQECDTARISIGNVDAVRYFADRLTGFNYYSYYGPKTVTGTYGTAILSRYPIISYQSVFTFSDQDEVGTAEVQVQIGGEIFYVYDSHPDGSDAAKLAQMNALLDQIGTKNKVIAMGDYNLREYEPLYQDINSTLQDAWKTRWPNGTDSRGVSIDPYNRIDYIFLSHDFTVVDTSYITDPQSDHPGHWAIIQW
jgi:endonuclease/exonuclease/phosphatase family metal-dependent hydrolase